MFAASDEEEKKNTEKLTCILTCSWGEVYSYLAHYDLTVPGGRLGPVGVPGLLLAGGVNFFGNQVGFSCNSVINYEVVLANGDVVQANKNTNSDLFWALKGGSSNFGIVTRFDLETIKSTKVWAGAHTVEAKYVDQFLAVSFPAGFIFVLLLLFSTPSTDHLVL